MTAREGAAPADDAPTEGHGPAPTGSGAIGVAAAVANAHVFFDRNSGWAPPDDETLAEWVADGVCRCPDECLVEPRGWCEHGLASWWLVLDAMGDVEVPDPDSTHRGT